MSQADTVISCASCGRPGRVADAMDNGWRYFRNAVGELVLFCALCAYSEFRSDAPAASTD